MHQDGAKGTPPRRSDDGSGPAANAVHSRIGSPRPTKSSSAAPQSRIGCVPPQDQRTPYDRWSGRAARSTTNRSIWWRTGCWRRGSPCLAGRGRRAPRSRTCWRSRPAAPWRRRRRTPPSAARLGSAISTGCGAPGCRSGAAAACHPRGRELLAGGLAKRAVIPRRRVEGFETAHAAKHGCAAPRAGKGSLRQRRPRPVFSSPLACPCRRRRNRCCRRSAPCSICRARFVT